MSVFSDIILAFFWFVFLCMSFYRVLFSAPMCHLVYFYLACEFLSFNWSLYDNYYLYIYLYHLILCFVFDFCLLFPPLLFCLLLNG